MMFSRTPKPTAQKQSIIKPAGTSLLSRPATASTSKQSTASTTVKSTSKTPLKSTTQATKSTNQSNNQSVNQSVPSSVAVTRSNSVDFTESESLASLVNQLFNRNHQQPNNQSANQSADDDVLVNDETFSTRLNAIRTAILLHGIDEESSSPSSSQSTNQSTSLRGQIWQLMLGVATFPHTRYLSLLDRKQCSVYAKIRSDSFRTFPNDALFQKNVSESSIVRLLNAFVWDSNNQSTNQMLNQNQSTNNQSTTFTYVQGMNTIAAPMLYCMPETQAYAAFKTFIDRTPLYWISAHIGVQAGCKLVDTVLSVIDPQLSAHLSAHRCESYVYAFHCVSSFSASVPPFSELLILWDFLLAFGLHLNILCVVASIVSMREKLLASNKPNNELNYRIWPEMKARQWIAMALSFVSLINAELYEDIRRHSYDRQVAERITGRKVERRFE